MTGSTQFNDDALKTHELIEHVRRRTKADLVEISVYAADVQFRIGWRVGVTMKYRTVGIPKLHLERSVVDLIDEMCNSTNKLMEGEINVKSD